MRTGLFLFGGRMPYTGPGDPKLPSAVQEMPLAKRRQWVAVFNSAYAACIKGGGSPKYCEGRAFPQAYGVVKKRELDMTEEEESGTAVLHEGETVGETASEEKDASIVEVLVEMPPRPLGGATSYEDADEYIESRDQEAFMCDQSQRFRHIFDNVWASEELDTDAKVAAINKATAEFAKRVKAGPEEGKSLLEKIKDLVLPHSGEKVAWTAAYVNDLPDSAFAYVEPGGKKDAGGKTVPRSLRHFPFKGAGGKVDLPHLRNALARAPQSPFGPKAMPKLRAAAEAAGVGKYAKEIWGAFTAFKDLAGAWRWLSVTTNKFKDLEGEIFTEASHKHAVAHADAEKDYPELRLWHVPKSEIGQADFVDYLDGFILHSGVFSDEAVAEKLSKLKGLAVSHGFEYRPGDEKDGVYEWYRTFEVSVLPAEWAANIYTDFAVEEKEASMPLTTEKRKFLVGVIGEERVAHIEEHLGEVSKDLEGSGVEFKDLTEAVEAEEKTPTDEPATDTKEPAAEDKATPVTMENMGEHVQAAVASALEAAIAPVTKLIEDMQKSFDEKATADEARLKALESTDEEKIAAALSPSRKAPGDGERPSQSKGTEVSEEEAAAAGASTEEPAPGPVDGYVEMLTQGHVPTPEGGGGEQV